MRTPSRIRTHAHHQIKCKKHGLGYYAVEADAAAAQDAVAKVLGSRLNFTKPRKITGQRSNGADQAVADAVKAANTFVLGTSMALGGWQPSHRKNPNYINKSCHAQQTPQLPIVAMKPAMSKRRRRTTQESPPHRRHRRPRQNHLHRLRPPRKLMVI